MVSKKIVSVTAVVIFAIFFWISSPFSSLKNATAERETNLVYEQRSYYSSDGIGKFYM